MVKWDLLAGPNYSQGGSNGARPSQNSGSNVARPSQNSGSNGARPSQNPSQNSGSNQNQNTRRINAKVLVPCSRSAVFNFEFAFENCYWDEKSFHTNVPDLFLINITWIKFYFKEYKIITIDFK